jgi:hypothetical protein
MVTKPMNVGPLLSKIRCVDWRKQGKAGGSSMSSAPCGESRLYVVGLRNV